MDSLPSPFTIEVNGTPIAKVGDETEDRTQAKTGSEAALFALKDGRLQSGDWFLGRSLKEDRTFLPKQVLWFKQSDDGDVKVQPVTAIQDGSEYKLRLTNACLKEVDGSIFADLQAEDDRSKIIVKG